MKRGGHIDLYVLKIKEEETRPNQLQLSRPSSRLAK